MRDDLLQYSCQLALPNFTRETQKQLLNARVLIVGLGGLGCPAAQYLASMGIGTLGIADYDIVSISNLHRQILYTYEEAGQQKSIVASKRLQKQNPNIHIISHSFEINAGNVFEIINNYDIVVDCTDNFDTRYLLTDACVLKDKPLVYGAIYQYEGQVAVWNTRSEDGTRTPNYRDVFPSVDASQIPNCAEGGVIPTIAGIIGCMQANEVIKYITKTGDLLAGKMLLMDARTSLSRIIRIGNTTATNITALEEKEKVKCISAIELNDQKNNNFYELIDVRTLEERNVFNIGGEHIPFNSLETESDKIDRTRPVVLYCATGRRSAEAVKMLKIKFPQGDFLSLKGGVKAWNEMLHGCAATQISPSS